jgi:hypothetical protein
MSEIIERLQRIEDLLLNMLITPEPGVSPSRDIVAELALLRAQGIDPVEHFKALSREDSRERRLKKKRKEELVQTV